MIDFPFKTNKSRIQEEPFYENGSLCHSRVFVVNDDQPFVKQVEAMLIAAGFSTTGFIDPIAALDAIRKTEGIELLVTAVEFSPGKPHGISLALMATSSRPRLNVLFTG